MNIQQPIEQNNRIVGQVTQHTLAPALNAFVIWVLKEALQSKKKRLYFLARDGYFMYLYAKQYVEKFQLPIECTYLYCSRYSLRVPMYHLDMEEALSYITLGGLDVSLDRIMKRAALTKEQQDAVLEALKLPYAVEEQIPREQLGKVRDALRCCQIFMKYVEDNSKEAYPKLEQYIRQEGLLENCSMAIVDSGWVGSMQKQLNRLITYIRCGMTPAPEPAERIQNKEADRSGELKAAETSLRATAEVPARAVGMDAAMQLEGYYWGLYEIPPQVKRTAYHTYFFSPEGEIRRKVYFSNCLFEGIFSAAHGMTLGYRDVQGTMKPKLADISSERKEFLKLTEIQLQAYLEKLLENMDKADFEKLFEKENYTNNLKETEKLMKKFMSKPSKEEASVYGQLYFSDDVLEYKNKKMAEPMNEKELRQNHLFYRVFNQLLLGNKPVKQSAWYEGSAVNCSRYAAFHRAGYVAYKYFLYYRQRIIWRHKK